MVNTLPPQYCEEELERNALNAAFNELGLRWHWDGETHRELLQQSVDAAVRIRHYLETKQAHLLKAYDASFLVKVIQEKTAVHRARLTANDPTALGHFNWAETLGRELGI